MADEKYKEGTTKIKNSFKEEAHKGVRSLVDSIKGLVDRPPKQEEAPKKKKKRPQDPEYIEKLNKIKAFD